jgi:two-component system osmolarity sensor histidine kinase EnvZ
LRELAQQFAELARQRRHLDEQRRTMLAAISHDLRSPLGRIRMAAELLPEAEGVALRREAINRNVQVADRLLGSFIDMARAEDEPIQGRVDLCALLQAVADDEEDVTLASLPSPPLWLQPASAVALERAVRNLVENARHHATAPIELSLHREAQGQGPRQHAVLSVRDHGPGIAPALRAQMVQPFLRGEQSRHTPGTGLGLSIVQRTAVRHGGQLLLQDAAPGLRAELRLPLA